MPIHKTDAMHEIIHDNSQNNEHQNHSYHHNKSKEIHGIQKILQEYAYKKEIAGTFPLQNPIDATVEDEFTMLNSIKQSQLDLLNSPAIKHISGTKNKVLYFAQANINYNTDMVNIIPPNPVNQKKYNRIENMIIVTDTELSQAFEITEEGMSKNEITAQGFMFPGVSPNAGDLFYLQDDISSQNKTLYHITSTIPISTLEKTGWQIEFIKHYEQYTLADMESMIADYYVFNFESVGTDTRVIFQETTFKNYAIIRHLFNKIADEYFSRFFIKERNIICYNYHNSSFETEDGLVPITSFYELIGFFNHIKIFDPFAGLFFNEAFLSKRIEYQGYPIFLTNPIWIGESFKNTYKYSIYSALIHRNPKLLRFFEYKPIQFKVSIIRDLSYDDWCYFDLSSEKEANCISLYPYDDFIDRIKTNSPYCKGDHTTQTKYNLFISYINDKTFIPTIESISAFTNNIEFMENKELYSLGPLLLYICAWYENLISNKGY